MIAYFDHLAPYSSKPLDIFSDTISPRAELIYVAMFRGLLHNSCQLEPSDEN